MLIGYARVSTEEQNLDMQIRDLQKAGCERIFSETISGGYAYKPEFEKALNIAREGDVLVVWKQDRLGRRTRDLIEISERLSKLGVNLRSLNDDIDTTTPIGRFYFHVMASLAQFELDNLRHRTNKGLEAAKARGVSLGRPKSITDQQWEMAKILLLKEEKPVPVVAETFDVSRDTIYRRIRKAKAEGAYALQTDNG
ncbi:recombinase family protein [Aestuariispira insulae]|uniref:DNA invertase Pin-like site-specific DNA recombinase n=1 Tax=Aestuariispira insulae TaxID=1461337 RepID=A0A3D9H3Q5_9PROT|nr:recombinase family protein [Aestuariispira insulae]RED44138.1 DNA invertase Pin-like site-specific DNA recombinase [Aestuariispira insulae]